MKGAAGVIKICISTNRGKVIYLYKLPISSIIPVRIVNVYVPNIAA